MPMHNSTTHTPLIAAFTGHRNYDHEADAELRECVARLYAEGYRHFRVGMAEGFDMAAGEAVVELMHDHDDILLEACIPYPTFYQRFEPCDKARYQAIIGHARLIRYAAESYNIAAFNLRNNMLVDDATYLVAWCSGRRSGTLYTLRRARNAGCTIKNIYPQSQLHILF